ncbi:MAG: terminase small subunit [Kordiimonadaceae bacterium]|nr:terminase small subunit [Kordiimonadaceae bacterium]
MVAQGRTLNTQQGLNTKQRMFVDEYLVDLNATQAAIRAGYAAGSADGQGSRLLANVHVKAQIDMAMRKRAERTKITQDRVMAEFAKIGFASMADYLRMDENGHAFVDLSNVTRDQAAAIGEVVVEHVKDGHKTKFKLLDKRAALVDMGKHLGMFVERKEITGRDGGPIQTEDVSAHDLSVAVATLMQKTSDAERP